MKKKIAKVLCLTMLLVSLASSAVVAAPASVQECKHEWGSAVFLETENFFISKKRCISK